MKNSSFLFIPFLLPFIVAAPYDSLICRQVPQNPAAGQIAAQYLHIPGCPDGTDGGSKSKAVNGTGSDSNKTEESTSRPGSIAPAKLQRPSTNTTAPKSSGGKCPAGFRNTVFNTGAPRNAGWPQTTWNSLSANGVNDWSKYETLHL